MTIFAFTGKRGHGKDTAAKALIEDGSKLLSFADPLREVCTIVYGLTTAEMADAVLKETPIRRWPFKSPREIMQRVGTEMFRAYLPDTWTKAFERRAQQYDEVVLSDLRFKNEEACLRDMDAVLIRIINPRKDTQDNFAQHISETEMDGIVVDHTIFNDADIKELHHRVRDIADYERHISHICKMVDYVDGLGCG